MSWMPYITMFLLMMVGLLLIFIVLLQRGRGGGLAGALGGMGGQSAFGTKAGDVFTRITIGLAAVWMILACVNVWAMRSTGGRFKGGSEAITKAKALEAVDEEKGQSNKADALRKGLTKDAAEGPASTDAEPADSATIPPSSPDSAKEDVPAQKDGETPQPPADSK